MQLLRQKLETERTINRSSWLLLSTGLSGIISFAVLRVNERFFTFTVCLIIGIAWLLFGFLLGFLFAITSVSNRLKKGHRLNDKDDSAEKLDDTYVYYSNNLTEIADWLTKIIIAATLIQIHALPNFLDNYSKLVSNILENAAFSKPFSTILLWYFLLIGFIIGYLKTFFYFSATKDHEAILFGKINPNLSSSVNESKDNFTHNTKIMDDLSAFVSEYVKQEDHFGAYFNNKTADNLYSLIQSEQHTEPLLATLFWQIVLSDPYFLSRALLDVPYTSIMARPEYIITSNGRGQYTLVIFAPLIPNTTIVKSTEEVVRENSTEAYYYWRRNVLEYFNIERSEEYARIVDAVEPNFVGEVISKLDLKIIITKKPRLIKQQLDFPSIPSPAQGVCPQGFSLPNSTAGIYAENQRGQKGVIICLHSLGDIDSAIAAIRDGNNKVNINNYTGKIITCDPISDSCFVVLDDQNVYDDGTFLRVKGILSGKTPRQYETGTFEGFKSGALTTSINGWSPDLPFVKRYNQLKLYTSPITNPGDSGSALKDSDGMVCGFAFERSGINENPQLSSWIWAESVFKFHNLKY